MKEVWRDVDWHWFSVSNLGRVYEYPRYVRHGKSWKLRKGGMYPQKAGGRQYPRLSMPGQRSVSTHQIVAKLFSGPDGPQKETVNHKNGVKTDNRVQNLEWATTKENIHHAINTGLIKPPRKAVIRLSDGMRFDSVREAAEYCGQSPGNLVSHLKGRQRSFAGERWAYAED